MKNTSKIIILSLLFFTLNSFSGSMQNRPFSEVPTTPPSPCYGGCNDFMTQLVSDFTLLGKTPSLEPAVYSGTCRHLGMYSPDHDHYAVVLLDQISSVAEPALETARFSAIHAFFYETNEFTGWNLETARKEMSSYWLEHGLLKFGDDTYHVTIDDENGNPVYVYWMRQNPITQELYYIYYSGHAMRSFCRLEKNKNQ